MASKRMISTEIINDEQFVDMKPTARLLYIYLLVNADDDGMIRQTKTMLWRASATEEDLKSLTEKGYIHQFHSGTIVILDWKTMNHITGAKYHRTKYESELAMLTILPSERYALHDMLCDAQYSSDQGSSVQGSAVQHIIAANNTVWQGNSQQTDTAVDSDEEILRRFGEECPDYVVPKYLSTKQKESIAALCRIFEISEIRNIFKKAQKSDFLRQTFNHGAGATFDWIVEPEHAESIRLGKYDSENEKPSKNSSFATNDFFEAAVQRSMSDVPASLASEAGKREVLDAEVADHD